MCIFIYENIHLYLSVLIKLENFMPLVFHASVIVTSDTIDN